VVPRMGGLLEGEGGQLTFVLYLDSLPSSNAERPWGHHILERISKLCFVDHEMATVRIPTAFRHPSWDPSTYQLTMRAPGFFYLGLVGVSPGREGWVV